MKSITAYGCSITAGESIGTRGAWPNQLAHIMGIKRVHNRGIVGASTKQVLHHILHTDPTGLVIVLWPIFSRTGFITDQGEWHRVLPGVNHLRPHKTGIADWYYEHVYSDTDARFEAHQHITLAHHYLASRQCEQHHFTWDSSTFMLERPLWNPTELHHLKFDYSLGLAPDQLHPGVAAHRKAAEEIHQKISK